VILGAFVAVLFSEIVSAKCNNAFPGVVLVIDSAAEANVDVANNGQFCPTSPQISVRLIEGLKRCVVQHTYQFMFHDHFVRPIIFVGIHVAKGDDGRDDGFLMVSTGSSRTRFPHADKPNPSSLPTTMESLRLLQKKFSVQKTLTSRYDLRLGKQQKLVEGARPARFSGSR
jgi:hypothetical protein